MRVKGSDVNNRTHEATTDKWGLEIDMKYSSVKDSLRIA